MDKNMLKGFRDFILRGNVVDLAVGVMVGAAFQNVVNALVNDLFSPFISVLFKQPNFSNFTVTIHGSQFQYGSFVNAVISFLVTAFAIYFFVVLPINKLSTRFKKPGSPLPQTTKKCPYCLSDIPKEAKKCAFCTSKID
ncbi:MAG TPA: large conductance mechanosensitive channel protein MscL [Candidatus Paceibacterota bacterium]|nr:large conductance mechanosensitive channel protein MscL [Candidatus Paceibacterota bacterium]